MVLVLHDSLMLLSTGHMRDYKSEAYSRISLLALCMQP